ncbi:MAG TPA: hypothetical protein VEP90_13965, partial [Methylomirabilota bacterium]|nr:hypothetical protein [Methylomirabilota bacterium]
FLQTDCNVPQLFLVYITLGNQRTCVAASGNNPLSMTILSHRQTSSKDSILFVLFPTTIFHSFTILNPNKVAISLWGQWDLNLGGKWGQYFFP